MTFSLVVEGDVLDDPEFAYYLEPTRRKKSRIIAAISSRVRLHREVPDVE
jgi:hypothetical protein